MPSLKTAEVSLSNEGLGDYAVPLSWTLIINITTDMTARIQPIDTMDLRADSWSSRTPIAARIACYLSALSQRGMLQIGQTFRVWNSTNSWEQT